MHLPEGGTSSQIVVNQCVLQKVITHMESVVRACPATLLEHPVLVGRGLRNDLQHVPVLDHLAVLSSRKMSIPAYSWSPGQTWWQCSTTIALGDRPLEFHALARILPAIRSK